MSYEDALSDLKADFGKKKLLTADDIAEHIGKTTNAQAALRSRKRFPIPQRSVGGRIVVSIYDLAHYIGDDASADGQDSARKATGEASAGRAKRRNFVQKPEQRSKPMRRASIELTRRSFQRQIADTELQLTFQRELLARIEAIELAEGLAKADRKSPAPPARRF